MALWQMEMQWEFSEDMGNRQIARNWQARRREMARAGLKRLVALVEAKDTERAAGPLPLHKGVYTDPVRFEVERAKLFLASPLSPGFPAIFPMREICSCLMPQARRSS